MAAVQAAAAQVLHVSPRAANLEDQEGKTLKGCFSARPSPSRDEGVGPARRLQRAFGFVGQPLHEAGEINEGAAVAAFANQAGFVAQAGD